MAASARSAEQYGGAVSARERAASRSEQGPVSSSSLIVLTAISIACALFVCLFRTPIARLAAAQAALGKEVASQA